MNLAVALARSFSYRVRRLSSESIYEAKPWHVLINWGSSLGVLGMDRASRVVNTVQAVRVAGNKLLTFQALKDKDGISIPEFTVDIDVARGWTRDGIDVVCRTVLSGHSGNGIVLAHNEAEVVRAPLYVKYIKKQDEYRVHVAFGEVIDVQQKRRKSGEEVPTNFQVRNHHTGWVYCRENIQLPDGAAGMAVKACQELGLDFGAVDIIYNAKRNQPYVLEINTAPGLEGTTVTKYTEAFTKQFKENA